MREEVKHADGCLRIRDKEEPMLIYVWNLSPNVEEYKFQQTFETFGQGQVLHDLINRLKNNYTGESRGFGLVKMPAPDRGHEALKNLNRKHLDGHRMIVFGSSEN